MDNNDDNTVIYLVRDGVGQIGDIRLPLRNQQDNPPGPIFGALHDADSLEDQEARNLRSDLIMSRPPLRRVDDGKGPVTNFEMAHMLELLGGTVVKSQQDKDKRSLPPQGPKFLGGGVAWRPYNDDFPIMLQNARHGMMLLNEFTSEEFEEKVFDKEKAMLELQSVMETLGRIADIAQPFLRSLPLAESAIAKMAEALDSVAESINPSEKRVPVARPSELQDYRTCVVAFRQNVYHGVMKDVWEKQKAKMEMLTREFKPQGVFVAHSGSNDLWMKLPTRAREQQEDDKKTNQLHPIDMAQ